MCSTLRVDRDAGVATTGVVPRAMVKGGLLFCR
jgi:hypothetical protein